MDFKIILMPIAINDLEVITGHIAKDDNQIAEQFGNELIDRTLPLSTFPEMGRVVPEFGDPAIREIIHSPYRILYRVRRAAREIHILRFWHLLEANLLSNFICFYDLSKKNHRR